jgi:IS1 family transposase/transposase-like protein
VKCRCCQGEEFKKFGRFSNRNVVVQRFQCLRCGGTYSESQSLDGVRIDHSKVVQIVTLLCEGLGVRSTARACDIDPHTVLNVLETVGAACERLHDRLARNIKTDSLEIDELWAKVGCSQKNAPKWDDEKGDQYTFLAVAAREKFIVSYHTGKRDSDNTDRFVHDVANRVDGRVQITTDAFKPYPDAIRHYLLERLDYAVMVKHFATPLGEVEAKRRYSPAPFIGVSVRVKAGNPRPDRICTSHVERQNLTVRHFNKRFARLSLGYSKTLANHRYAIALFVCAYNFCKVHGTMGCTPAVAVKMTEETWTIEKLIEESSTL